MFEQNLPKSTFSWPGMRPATGWIPNRTLIFFSLRIFTISAIAYCAFATARPYPGTIIIFFEFTIASTELSTLISVCVPVIFIFSPVPITVIITINIILLMLLKWLSLPLLLQLSFNWRMRFPKWIYIFKK